MNSFVLIMICPFDLDGSSYKMTCQMQIFHIGFVFLQKIGFFPVNLGNFSVFLKWEGAWIRLQLWPMKIPGVILPCTLYVFSLFILSTKKHVKTDGLENIHDFMLKNVFCLNLCMDEKSESV